jgi:lipopolysaccharide biosynthesis protein
MNNICFYSCYYESGELPYYVMYYLQELRRHCRIVVLITNEKEIPLSSLDFLKSQQVELMQVVNEGFDFGMWAKALKKYSLNEFDQLILANDSCIVFKKLDFVFSAIRESEWDFSGMLETWQIQHHLQAYFMAVNKKAFSVLLRYFNENEAKGDIQHIIRVFEVGLSTYMQQQGMKIGAVFHGACDKQLNPAYSGIEILIDQGFPMIKKKILFGTFRKSERMSLLKIGFRLSPGHYLNVVKKNIQREAGAIDLGELEKDIARYSNGFMNALYDAYSLVVRIGRRIPGVRFVYKLLTVRK